MSVENLYAFVDKAKNDESLKQRLHESQSPADVISLGKENGFEFSEDDMHKASKEKMSSGEISQEDLDKVSGGTITIGLTMAVCPILVTSTICKI